MLSDQDLQIEIAWLRRRPYKAGTKWAMRLFDLQAEQKKRQYRIWAELGGEIKYLNERGNWTLDKDQAKPFRTKEAAERFAARVGQEGPAQYESIPQKFV